MADFLTEREGSGAPMASVRPPWAARADESSATIESAAPPDPSELRADIAPNDPSGWIGAADDSDPTDLFESVTPTVADDRLDDQESQERDVWLPPPPSHRRQPSSDALDAPMSTDSPSQADPVWDPPTIEPAPVWRPEEFQSDGLQENSADDASIQAALSFDVEAKPQTSNPPMTDDHTPAPAPAPTPTPTPDAASDHVETQAPTPESASTPESRSVLESEPATSETPVVDDPPQPSSSSAASEAPQPQSNAPATRDIANAPVWSDKWGAWLYWDPKGQRWLLHDAKIDTWIPIS